MNALELTHVWANREAPKGVAGSVSFDGPCLYSYQTLVAVIATRSVDAHAPMRIALTTYRRYSVTTSSHIAAARSAAHTANLPSVGVADVSAPLKHDVNMLGIAKDVLAKVQQGMRAKVYRLTHINQAVKRMGEFNLYCTFFGLPERMHPDENTHDMLAHATQLVDMLGARCRDDCQARRA